jgi:ArsR family transcriptional regulator
MTKRKICSHCFALIGEGTRMKMLQYLKKKPANVKEIGRHFSLTQPTISHHLAALKKIGMILNRKSGREIYYFLNKKYPCKKCSLFKIPFKL